MLAFTMYTGCVHTLLVSISTTTVQARVNKFCYAQGKTCSFSLFPKLIDDSLLLRMVLARVNRLRDVCSH